MKVTDKDKPIRTIPEGVWESSNPNVKENCSKKQHLNNITTDIQGNGYPVSHKTQDD